MGSSFSVPGQSVRALSKVSVSCGLIAFQGISALSAHNLRYRVFDLITSDHNLLQSDSVSDLQASAPLIIISW